MFNYKKSYSQGMKAGKVLQYQDSTFSVSVAKEALVKIRCKIFHCFPFKTSTFKRK